MFISILAFGDPKDTIDQIENIYSENHIYFVHWNKRDNKKDNLKKLQEYFKLKKNIIFYSKYKVYWGHYSILKTIIFASNYFIKNTNENFFLNLDNKTISLRDIDEIEFLINKENELNKNFMGFLRKYSNYIDDKQLKYYDEQLESYLKEDSWRKIFKYKFLSVNSKHTKLNKIVHLINPFFLIKFLFNSLIKFSIKEGYRSLFFVSSISEKHFMKNIYLKKSIKIPKKLKEFEMIFMNQIGTFLCINRNDIEKINKSKEFFLLKKIAKKCLASEEFFYHSLYWNLINKNINDSLLIHLSSTNWKEKIEKEKLEKIKKDIYFIRRVQGINEIKQVYKNLEITNEK